MNMTFNHKSSQVVRTISSAKARMSHAAPFNSTSTRKIWKKDMNPGVGQYELMNNITKTNLITENHHENIIIYDLPNNSSSFKSSTKRFNCFSDQKPGPGDYNVDNIKHTTLTKKNKRQSSKLMHYLSQQYKKTYEPAPQNLEINQSQAEKKDAKVNTKKEGRIGSSAFTSKAKRDIFQRPLTSAGPGSYEINNSCFTNKKTYQKTSDVKQRNTSTSQNLNNFKADNVGQSFQNIIVNLSNYHEAVGPGYYESQPEQTMSKKSFSKGIECFGSKVPRFNSKKFVQNNQILPGPGFYDPNCNQNHKNSNKKPIVKVHKNNQPVFGFGSTSAKQFKVTTNTQVCPFSYNTTNDFSQLLRENYLRGSIGNFGSTQQRFNSTIKNEKSDKQPENLKQFLNWKQFFNINNKCNDQQGEPKISMKKFYPKSAKVIKRKPKQETIEKKQQSDLDERPLCYDNTYKTIGSKFSNKTQSDSPFFSKVHRFKTEQKITLLQEIAVFKNAKNGSIHKKQIAKNVKPRTAIHKFRA